PPHLPHVPEAVGSLLQEARRPAADLPRRVRGCSSAPQSWKFASMSSLQAVTTYSGTASNFCGLSCITYSFSMWYVSFTNFVKILSLVSVVGLNTVNTR